jgi:hypothetical protein
MKMDNVKRNREILKLVDTHRLSYEVIAEMMGVTRCTVAGVVFRRAHPPATRVVCPNGRWRTKAGKGWQPQSYYPEKTAANIR